MKEFLSFITSKTFLKHFALSVAIVIFLTVATFLSLNLYTSHGNSYQLPDFKGLNEAQLSEMIEDIDLRYQIIDSVHITNTTPGIVVDQTPKPGVRVKKNRTVFLTINAWTPEKVLVPRLQDYSLRNAEVMLESYGLKIGKLIYVPSEYSNLILGQHFQGKPIEPGTPILKGSEIDLLVGKGLGGESTGSPDLLGLTIEEANSYLTGLSLNLGVVAYDQSVVTREDSLNAFIWKQNPPTGPGAALQMGASVDIWVTRDSTRLNTQEESSFDIQ
jgi:beta-lactam-binding protein with PASTA domain